ncbi:MAG TPA: CDGSH iron-sulfur domain-containing protein [Pontiella sp.]
MDKLKIVHGEPIRVTLEPGQYGRCNCKRSSNYPFCDGSHRGSDIEPTRFVIKERQEVALCNCGRSNNQPFCDGSHRK